MTGSELIVALFALVFLAFCLTAIAFIAMSKDKDEIADKSVAALRELNSKTEAEKKNGSAEDQAVDSHPPQK